MLPPLTKMRAVVERMRNLSDMITLRASSSSCLRLSASTEVTGFLRSRVDDDASDAPPHKRTRPPLSDESLDRFNIPDLPVSQKSSPLRPDEPTAHKRFRMLKHDIHEPVVIRKVQKNFWPGGPPPLHHPLFGNPVRPPPCLHWSHWASSKCSQSKFPTRPE